MSEDKPSLDILGIKPVADAVNTVTKATVDGAAAFLGRICLPAAEEYGLFLRDRVHLWRTRNIAAVTAVAERKLEQNAYPSDAHAHPRMVSAIIEEGSWIEDPVVQEMWGGLLSSSCTHDGDDDSNLIFLNVLSQLTRLQARLLQHACENSEKVAAPTGLVYANEMVLALNALQAVTGELDICRLDRELDHLREIGLIDGGFWEGDSSTDAHIKPTALALNLFVRCEGSRLSPLEYFQLAAHEDESS